MATTVRHIRIPQSRWDQAEAKAASLGTDRAKLVNALLVLAASGALDGLLAAALAGQVREGDVLVPAAAVPAGRQVRAPGQAPTG